MKAPLTSWTAEANAELQALKKQSRYLTAAAVKEGYLFKPATCSRCGADKNIEAHHLEYLNPYAVEWLCRACHRALHARMVKDAAHRLCVPEACIVKRSTRKPANSEQNAMSKGRG